MPSDFDHTNPERNTERIPFLRSGRILKGFLDLEEPCRDEKGFRLSTRGFQKILVFNYTLDRTLDS